MIVKELIDQLKKLPKDSEVILMNTDVGIEFYTLDSSCIDERQLSRGDGTIVEVVQIHFSEETNDSTL